MIQKIEKEIEGFPMSLNPHDGGISSVLIKKGKREPCFMWLLRQQRGRYAIDCGANIGYTTLSMCKNFASVYAFEPDDRSRELLQDSILLNDYREKCSISEAALSDMTGYVFFEQTPKPNLSKISTSGRRVESVRIDDIDIYPDFIKMDVEGGEVRVLHGAKETLTAIPKCSILIEVHPQFYDEANDFRECLEYLLEVGYKITHVVSAGMERPDLFMENNYYPSRTFANCRRAIYNDISQEHAVDWASRVIEQKLPNGKVSPKIIRAILIEKGI